jgi:hypothetical protein
VRDPTYFFLTTYTQQKNARSFELSQIIIMKKNKMGQDNNDDEVPSIHQVI